MKLYKDGGGGKNTLYYGDNLTVMKLFSDNSIDLIYLDPPFNSNRTYNVMYRNMTGEEVPEQVEAFCDTWEMDQEKQDLLNNMVVTMNHYKMDADFVALWDMWIKALRNTRRDLTAYLLYMTVRLLEMRRILKHTGSIYLHCDPTASHYLKVLMDGIFGHKNFRNEIVWCYKRMATSKQKHFSKCHDIILFYSSTSINTFFPDKVRLPYSESSIKRQGYKKTSLGGGIIKSGICELNNKGRFPEDWWDIPIIRPNSKERLGYPTQKPLKLLDRIIKASCPADGVVLDPFCGCGTTLYAAHENSVKWIGIDIAILSTRLVVDTLNKKYSIQAGDWYEIDGIPVSEEQARFLWKQDPFQFQNWAVEYVRGFCTNKKTRDGGVDGRLYFKDKKKKLQEMIISVKGGKLKAQDVRDLIGTVENNGSVFGGIISFDRPTKSMLDEKVKMGTYTDRNGNRYDRLQFLSVDEMLTEKKLFNIPNNINRKDYEKNPQSRLYF